MAAVAGCTTGTGGGEAPQHASASGTTSSHPRTTAHGQWWSPQPGQQWQWQLSDKVDTSVDVPVYDLDWQTPKSVVDDLHRQGRRVICYVSVGTWEAYRDDAQGFPEEVRGRALEDWPDERWLDIRQRAVLAPVLLKRLDTCRDNGFDAVEPDNVDAFANDSGFPLTAQDQLDFNRWIADEAHARGLGVGLKNDLAQVPQLVEHFDFAVNEECAQYDECAELKPFVSAGKAVLHAEYEMTADSFCAQSGPPGFSSILKRYDLDSWRVTCRNGSPVGRD
ncbi:MAG: endo alpha-1,4 polygalactosaminidase [Actinomycetes bacterium]